MAANSFLTVEQLMPHLIILWCNYSVIKNDLGTWKYIPLQKIINGSTMKWLIFQSEHTVQSSHTRHDSVTTNDSHRPQIGRKIGRVASVSEFRLDLYHSSATDGSALTPFSFTFFFYYFLFIFQVNNELKTKKIWNKIIIRRFDRLDRI